MRKTFIFILFFALGSKWVVAQPYASKHKWFEVDQIRGCAPFTIKITNDNLSGQGGCTTGTPCSMNFDGTGSCPPLTSCQNVKQFTYNNPGTYILQVTYQGIGPDTIYVKVDPDIQPAFDMYSCGGSKVEVNVTDKNYDLYNIDINSDGVYDKTIPSGPNQTSIFTYSAPGNYTIKVQGQKLNADNNCTPKAQPFKALATLPVPSINTLTAVSTDTLQLAFTPQTNIQYKGEIAFNNDNNFQVYKTLYGVSSMNTTPVNVDNNYYCFRLSSYDPCANINKYSPTVCSQKFNVSFNSGVDQLSWQTSGTTLPGNTQINRDGSLLKSVAGSVTSYPDNAIKCKTTYCYQLISNYGTTKSISLEKCGKAILIATPTAINNVSSVVGSPQVDLTWLQDPAFTVTSYNIFRNLSGGNYSFLDSASQNLYTDATYGGNPYCYQINYKDDCDNPSAKGLPVCPIRLTGTVDLSNDVKLDWSGYKGWEQGVKGYRLIKYYAPGQSGIPVYSGPDTTSTDYQTTDLVNQVVYYKVIATAVQPGVTQSLSNEIRIVKNVDLYYPTAFNPESSYVDPITRERTNRTFNVRGHYIASLKLEVFDRWGALVFSSDKDEAWDGKRDGNPMPDATYVWTAEGMDHAGNSFKKAGTVLLIRK